jgi:hypothetical protein
MLAGATLAGALGMATRLEGSLKREIEVERRPYTLTITAERFKLVPKGHRKGLELAWKDLLSGEEALAVALNASLARLPDASAARATAVTRRARPRKLRP